MVDIIATVSDLILAVAALLGVIFLFCIRKALSTALMSLASVPQRSLLARLLPPARKGDRRG